jgi:misacylated tRNA(Ala) deacylase
MTRALFREDAYLRACEATVVALHDDGIELDQTVFYAMGGGQPGDTGLLEWQGHSLAIIDTRYGESGSIRHRVAEGSELPAVGQVVTATLNWDRRYRHMRMHTAMHLLGTVLTYGVTGGNITEQRSRLDFDMQDTVDKEAVEQAVQALVDQNHAVSSRWITEADLDAQPELVRTLSVQPPRGAGTIRLLEIEGVDLQPCGGTHLAATGEVGRVQIDKVEKKGKHNRRVYLSLAD